MKPLSSSSSSTTTTTTSTRKRKRMAEPAASSTTAATLIGSLCSLSLVFLAVAISFSIETVGAFQVTSLPSTRAVLLTSPPSTSATLSTLHYSNDYESPKSKAYNTKNNLPSYLLPSISVPSTKDSSSISNKTPTIKQRLALSSQATNMKQRLLEEITEFRRLVVEEEKSLREQQQTKQDTSVSSSSTTTTSLPQMIDYYSISKRVGDQAKVIVDLCNDMSEFNPNPTPTRFLADDVLGDFAPLNGSWKSLFTTASDADFSVSKRRSSSIPSSTTSFPSKTSKSSPNNDETQNPRRPKVQNIVDASAGTITNVVDFPITTSSTTTPVNRLAQLEQLNVVIKASPLSSSRVGLDFKYAKLIFRTQFQPFWDRRSKKLIQFRWPIFIPIPPTFVVRNIVALNRLRFKLKQRWTKLRTRRRGDTDVEAEAEALDKTETNKKEFLPPKPFFDVLYLDDNLRIHKTGESNYFVQAKDTWTAARTLLDE